MTYSGLILFQLVCLLHGYGIPTLPVLRSFYVLKEKKSKGGRASWYYLTSRSNLKPVDFDNPSLPHWRERFFFISGNHGWRGRASFSDYGGFTDENAPPRLSGKVKKLVDDLRDELGSRHKLYSYRDLLFGDLLVDHGLSPPCPFNREPRPSTPPRRMVTARELRKTLGETMGEKGSSSRPRRTPARRAVRQAEADREEIQREEPPRGPEARSPPRVVQLKPEEEEEQIEQQLLRRREKRPRAETKSPPPQASGGQGTGQVGASSSGYANCSMARERVQKLMAEEGDGFMVGVRPEDVFDMAMHHAYQATLLSYDGAVRVQRMARLSRDQLVRCQKMEEKMSAMEGKIKKAEEDRTTAEMKQSMAESLLELSRRKVTELEQDV